MTSSPLLLPVKLDAFVFNAAVCGGTSKDPREDKNKGLAKIAPLSQPNYTFLRFERTMVQNDVTEFADLHKTGPAAFNRRFTDVGTGKPHAGRQGVYVHWIVPRPYRSGSAVQGEQQNQQQQNQNQPQQAPDTAAPDFRPAPARWMVVRKVQKCDPSGALPDIDAWVVESDRHQALDDIPGDVDIQAEFSPYVVGGAADSLDGDAMKRQAEVFIGHKESAHSWTEKEDPSKPASQQPGRVDLNLLNSSNQLFADYQPHNSNVFSMVDTLSYGEGDERKAVNSATVSYYVLGWHAVASKDPLGNLDPKAPHSTTRAARLAALHMALDQTDPASRDGVTRWLESHEPSRVLCHGAMYDVRWDAGTKPPRVPADAFAQKLSRDMPVAVGTTPMDALLTYVKSHADHGDDDDGIKRVEKDLLRIQKLLHARDEGVDAEEEAADVVYNWNYAASNGGTRFFFSGSDEDGSSGKEPTRFSPENVARLAELNRTHQYLDGLARQLQLLRHDMFALWWQYMTDLNPPDPVATQAAVDAKTNAIEALLGAITTTTQQAKRQRAEMPKKRGPGGEEELVQAGVLPPFKAARDPTMLVAGLESGWPWDFLNNLKVRLDEQVAPGSVHSPSSNEIWDSFVATVLPKLPAPLVDAATHLVHEFQALDPANQTPPEKDGYRLPLYHDLDKAHRLPGGDQPWRDRWEQSQAWFPLFVEWVAEYTHIQFPLGKKKDEYWTLDQRGGWPSEPKKLRYGIAPGVELADLNIQNRRTVSGRVLILPQASLNLQTIVNQILDDDSLPDGLLTPEQIANLRDHLHQLAFLSSPLAGFTDHLLTRVHGNHIKPTLRQSGNDSSGVVPFKAAVDVGVAAGFAKTQLYMMGLETDLAPYGTLVQHLGTGFSPFKPATHGQFRFTAINIVDKFGQAVAAIDPEPSPAGPDPLYPCLSEYYAPQPSSKDPKRANTVVHDTADDGACQYVQLPPTLNQPARLNTAVVDYFSADETTGAAAGWRPLDELSAADEDRFVWGWVVPNYADRGIQLFLPDGTFYREICLGGPHGAQKSGTFLPFASPQPSEDKFRDLELLAQRLTDKDYLQSFAAMLDASLGTTAPPPTAYANFLSSIVGRPLALTKMAFSLELATAPYSNESGINTRSPELPLPGYKLGLQLGDASRVHDGLIGYFRTSGGNLDLDTIFTHFVPPQDPEVPTPKLTKIAPDNYPTLRPFWPDPLADSPGDTDPTTAYEARRNVALRPVGALVDPFVPVHAHTGVLPPEPARLLPPWTWQRALRRMTAFFRAGPLLSPADVPGFVEGNRLRQDYDLAKPNQKPPGAIGVPAMQSGKWAWLQPYSVGEGTGEGDNGGQEETAYMALGVAAVDPRPRFETAPYVAVEGYMQLRQPIEEGAAPKAAE